VEVYSLPSEKNQYFIIKMPKSWRWTCKRRRYRG